MPVEFVNNSAKVKAALNEASLAYLYEAAGEIEAQVKRNTKTDTGQLKNSWTYVIDEDRGLATIGSPLENAVWEEFGTGEYAAKGNGRKGGWSYKDDEGKWHRTVGKKPHRAFIRAYNSLKKALISKAEEVLKGRLK